MNKNHHSANNIALQFCRNVKALSRIKSYPMTKLESAIGVSNGYFARCLKSNATPGIDILYAVSQIFDVTMEDLISNPIENKLLRQLIKTTLTDAMAIAGKECSKDDIIQIIQEEM